MQVVYRDSVPDAVAPLLPVQTVERTPERTMEGGGKGNGLESRQMLAHADL